MGAAATAIWTIGAVARETGLSPHTIRVWARRYGFPNPRRKPSGHRLYSETDVRRLQLIVAAIRLGHRPGQAVRLPHARLAALVRDGGRRSEAAWESSAVDRLGELFELVRGQRGDELTAALLQDASLLGPLDFIEKRAVPLIERIGEAWEARAIGIRHEHFFSERLGDVLRALRMPHERSARGPRILLATLPGERHALGLQMAALVIALAAGRPDVLGAETPAEEIAESWRTHRAAAVGISVSVASAGPDARRALETLRRAIPEATPIFVGGRGAGASEPPIGVAVLPDLASLYDWTRRAGARRGA